MDDIITIEPGKRGSKLMQTINWQMETEQEFDDMGSFNHSLVQGNIAYVFRKTGKYSALIELSLDSSSLDPNKYSVKDEMIPDVAIYPKRSLLAPYDILRTSEMPLLAAEVVSPRQWATSLVDKFAAYFALGVQSCWLVDPTFRVVQVYKSLVDHETFATGNVRDSVLNVSFPISEIFD